MWVTPALFHGSFLRRFGLLADVAPLALILASCIDGFGAAGILLGLDLLHDGRVNNAVVLLCLATVMAYGFSSTELTLPATPRRRIFSGLGQLIMKWLAVSGFLYLSLWLTDTLQYFPDDLLPTWIAITPFCLTSLHLAFRTLFASRLFYRQAVRNVIIVGVTEASVRLLRQIHSTPMLRLNVVGFVDDRSTERLEDPGSLHILGKQAELADLVKRLRIHEVIFATPMSSEARLKATLDGLYDTTASIHFLPDLGIFDSIQARFDHICGMPLITVCNTPFAGCSQLVKRSSDIVLSLLILLLIWPLLILIAIAVKLDSPGPVLFRQRRYGVDGDSIPVLKFRTMTVMEDGSSVVQARKDDARITRVGAFLRKTSLDELPQFFNALTGSMSIVGPRPHANAHNEFYRRQIKGYMLRHKVKPGITGWAQVNGCRGETDSLEKMARRIDYDLEYLRNWSFWLDLKIIALTVVTVLKRENAY